MKGFPSDNRDKKEISIIFLCVLAGTLLLLTVLFIMKFGNTMSPSITDPSAAAAQSKQKTNKMPESKGQFTSTQKEKYQKQIQARLNDYGQKLDTLQKNGLSLGKIPPKTAQDQINGIREKMDIAMLKFNALDTMEDIAWIDAKAEGAWNQVKAEMDKAMEDLDGAFIEADDRLN